MTSFDGRRSLRETLDTGSRKGLHEINSSFTNHRDTSPIRLPARAVSTQYLVPSKPPKYFFGSDPFRDCPRPSTLPRRPRHTKRPVSLGNFEDHESRFHSIPRTRAHRSPSGDRGQSEPPPFKENVAPIAYLSSGAITSTPISPTIQSGPSFPIIRQENLNRSNSFRSEGYTRSSNTYDATTRRESLDELQKQKNNPAKFCTSIRKEISNEEMRDPDRLKISDKKEFYEDSKYSDRKDSTRYFPSFRRELSSDDLHQHRKESSLNCTSTRKEIFTGELKDKRKTSDNGNTSLRKSESLRKSNSDEGTQIYRSDSSRFNASIRKEMPEEVKNERKRSPTRFCTSIRKEIVDEEMPDRRKYFGELPTSLKRETSDEGLYNYKKSSNESIRKENLDVRPQVNRKDSKYHSPTKREMSEEERQNYKMNSGDLTAPRKRKFIDKESENLRKDSTKIGSSFWKEISEDSNNTYRTECGGFNTPSLSTKEIHDKTQEERRDSYDFTTSLKREKTPGEEMQPCAKDSKEFTVPIRIEMHEDDTQDHKRDSGVFSISAKRETPHEMIHQIYSEDGRTDYSMGKLCRETGISANSEESGSSLVASAYTSDEEKSHLSPPKVVHILRSNTSVTSGKIFLI